ncbi:PREDICTED: A disintegrin and metalloproteinase with thrombospondin motifs 19-like, partial [Thamnophis sirtalis]|uniref:A disintegrin and metalloproteinase with thrombospondin motifs 19-like n=1 Tax=Thamnophis sirtalis TaxID=35019 RepID=A0A6I9Z1Q8_9SAUR
MEAKRERRLSHLCCIFYQLCFLSDRITSGLQPLGDFEEWEIVYPALWSRSQQESTGGSGAGGSCSLDGNCGNSSSNINATSASTQGVGSSREIRSVSSSSDHQHQQLPVRETSEDEYESQDFYHWSPLPQGSNGTSQQPSYLYVSPSEDEDEMLLRIPAFAQELYLLLKRDSRFLAPGFAVEERLLNEKSTPNLIHTQTERACYYSGSVLHYPGSFASFSTCGGLIGFLQMNDDFIFIEPFNHSLAVIGQAHRVCRRKRSIRERPSEKSTSHSQYCSVFS